MFVNYEVMDSISKKEKLQSSDALRDHVMTAQKERDLYNNFVKRAKETNALPPAERLTTILLIFHKWFPYTQIRI